MFTECEVDRLRTLSNSEQELKHLKAHYYSYIAASHITVYNPVSVMSAFETSSIENFWATIGECPLLSREFPPDVVDIAEDLLAGADIQPTLMDSVTY